MNSVWLVDDTAATLAGRDLGMPAPLSRQVQLGDFWIPQRGMFAFGDGWFDAYDPTRHLQVATRHEISG